MIKALKMMHVAFVKGANDRNWFLIKNKQSNIWRTSPDEQYKGLTIPGTNWFGNELRQVTKVGVSLHQ